MFYLCQRGKCPVKYSYGDVRGREKITSRKFEVYPIISIPNSFRNLFCKVLKRIFFKVRELPCKFSMRQGKSSRGSLDVIRSYFFILRRHPCMHLFLKKFPTSWMWKNRHIFFTGTSLSAMFYLLLGQICVYL